MKKIAIFVISLLIALSFSLCLACDNNNGSGNTSGETKYTLSLDKSSYTLDEDDYFKLTATVSPNGTVKWTSSDALTASVVDGTVIGKKAGEVTITATCGNASATCSVTVLGAAKDFTILESAKEIYNLELGGATNELDFAVWSVSSNGTKVKLDDQTITYSIANTNFATESNGVLTAQRRGRTTITATCGDLSTTVDVVIYDKFISNCEEWNYMLARRSLGEMYMLDADIDYNGQTYEGMYKGTPTESSANCFQATIEGNGHTVKNVSLVCSGSDRVSLFGCIRNAKISNISFENISFSGNIADAAGIATSIYGASALVENVYAEFNFTVSAINTSVLFNFVYGGTYAPTVKNLVVVATTYNGSAAGTIMVYSGELSSEKCENIFVYEKGATASAGATEKVYSEKNDMIWDINGTRALDTSVWQYRATSLPTLYVK